MGEAARVAEGTLLALMRMKTVTAMTPHKVTRMGKALVTVKKRRPVENSPAPEPLTCLSRKRRKAKA